MHEPFINRRSVIIVVIGAFLAVMLVATTYASLNHTVHYPYLELDDGWRLRGNVSSRVVEQTYIAQESASINNFPTGMKGDYFQISKELPDMGNIPFPTIMFETRYAAVEVSVNGVVIYRYGMDAAGSNGFTGSTYHFVTLPEEYAGEFVTITLYRTEDHAGRAINTPYIGAHEDMESLLLSRNFFSLSCGFFMVVYGLSFLLLTMIFIRKVPELMPQMVTSLLCVCLGVVLVTNDHIGFLFINAITATEMDYLAIYMLVPLAFMLIKMLGVEHVVPDKLFGAVALCSNVAVLVFYALHFLDIIHLNRMLFVYYGIAFAGMVIIIADVFRGIRDDKLPIATKITLYGLAAIVLCTALDMLLIVMWRMGADVEEGAGRNLIPLGALIFAALQVVNYLSFVSEAGNRQKDFASLQNIAYADALTGLSNRARADRVFEELDKGREDYCLVSVDVNGLKDTNDRLGHAAGDRLLKDYAEALRKNFGDEALCARMGGDEFLVVMKKTNADGFGVRLRRLYADLDEMNAADKSMLRSAAIGYAFRHECHGGDAHTVYLLADERMFENKREQHARLRIKDRE